MQQISLFPFSEYWWAYVAFNLFVLALLALDLGVFHKKSHVVSVKEASIWTVVWISLAMLFNLGLYLYSSWKFAVDPRLLAVPGFDAAAAAKQVSLEFLTGFIVEKSLAVDNIFIFVVVFSYFAIPRALQHRVLFYGILGALFFRALFIAMGSLLMQYHLVIYIFGAFLILTGIKLMFAPEKPVDPEKNLGIRVLKKFLPITPRLEGEHFFVRKEGKLFGTPLLVALVFLEFTDIIFAVDSVPAIFALTKEPWIVFTSNIFAILGLRSMYFLLANVVDKFHLLKYGLAVILVFVGLKMVWLNDVFNGKFPISWSLGFIGSVLAVSIASSLFFPKKAHGN